MNYVLKIFNKDTNTYRSQPVTKTTEYCRENEELSLCEEVKMSSNGKPKKYYRLYALQPHTIEDALALNIMCPRCMNNLKKVTRCTDYYDLGLYICPKCSNK